MTAPIDPLARLLVELRTKGSAASGRLTDRVTASVQPLVEAGVIVEARSGSGRALVLHDADALETFIKVHYPGGLAWASPTPSRADAVRQARNSKRAGAEWAIVTLRGRRGTVAIEERVVDIEEATRVLGCCSVMVSATTGGQLRGIERLAIVENIDVFGRAFEVPGLPDVVVYAGGRIKEDVLRWLLGACQDTVAVHHVPDYDLVGLGEFARIRGVFGARAQLWAPDNLSDLFNHANASLFAKQCHLRLDAYLTDRDPRVREVAGLIQRTGACLEQEILLHAVARESRDAVGRTA